MKTIFKLLMICNLIAGLENNTLTPDSLAARRCLIRFDDYLNPISINTMLSACLRFIDKDLGRCQGHTIEERGICAQKLSLLLGPEHVVVLDSGYRVEIRHKKPNSFRHPLI